MARVEYWNHNVHYQPVILGAVLPGCGAALEVGCGDGLLARRLAGRCAEVTAIDRDARMIALARASFDFACAELEVRRQVGLASLRDEPAHVTILPVEQEEHPLGLAHAGQRRPRQEDGQPVRRPPGHPLVPELVLVYPALPHSGRERVTRLVPR